MMIEHFPSGNAVQQADIAYYHHLTANVLASEQLVSYTCSRQSFKVKFGAVFLFTRQMYIQFSLTFYPICVFLCVLSCLLCLPAS